MSEVAASRKSSSRYHAKWTAHALVVLPLRRKSTLLGVLLDIKLARRAAQSVIDTYIYIQYICCRAYILAIDKNTSICICVCVTCVCVHSLLMIPSKSESQTLSSYVFPDMLPELLPTFPPCSTKRTKGRTPLTRWHFASKTGLLTRPRWQVSGPTKVLRVVVHGAKTSIANHSFFWTAKRNSRLRPTHTVSAC